ncbi:MAG: hypothetical protein ACOVQ4_16295 [Flectobacillus sp.]|uniref:hypothetical protein n=1 Tax=Flectobacillus sp. TaxID=50419 RepID=UPI003B9B3266
MEPSNNNLLGKKPTVYSDYLSLYDQYGALAYGVILQIIPNEQLAQEVLVSLFSSASLQGCNENVVNKTICIIRNARAKAVEYKSKYASSTSPPINEGQVSEDTLPKLVFELSFKQGLKPEVIAEKLNITRERVLKAFNEYFKLFR